VLKAGAVGLGFLVAVDFFLVLCLTGDGRRSWAVRGRGPEGANLMLGFRSVIGVDIVLVIVAFLVVLRRAGHLEV